MKLLSFGLFFTIFLYFYVNVQASWSKCKTASFQHYLCNGTSKTASGGCEGIGGPPNCHYISGDCICNYLFPCQDDGIQQNSYRQILLNYSIDIELDDGFISLSTLTYHGNPVYNNYSILPTGIEIVSIRNCYNYGYSGLFDVSIPFGTNQKISVDNDNCSIDDVVEFNFLGAYFNYSTMDYDISYKNYRGILYDDQYFWNLLSPEDNLLSWMSYNLTCLEFDLKPDPPQFSGNKTKVWGSFFII